MKKLFFAANWKMYLSTQQELAFAQIHKQELEVLALQASIALFPSFISLAAINSLYKDSSIAIGAQNCSSFAAGAHTGEISVQSLAELGCTFCLVGHSERRALGETIEQISQKISRLTAHGITPILCIGETAQDRASGKLEQTLREQINGALKSQKPSSMPNLVTAYEPIWAIGTGQIPSAQEVSLAFEIIIDEVAKNSQVKQPMLLYGGSISSTTIKPFLSIAMLDGFLIGGASIDFQEFKKTVSSAT